MTPMTNDRRSLLDVLKAELEFLEKGGYRHTVRATWRPPFVFQDSPTCLNFDSTKRPRPCSECVLTQLVPQESAKKRTPCHYIPLNDRSETIDSLYRSGTQEELEAALRGWLNRTIQRLEKERSTSAAAAEVPEVHVQGKWSDANGRAAGAKDVP